jgi:hypothetical protein
MRNPGPTIWTQQPERRITAHLSGVEFFFSLVSGSSALFAAGCGRRYFYVN